MRIVALLSTGLTALIGTGFSPLDAQDYPSGAAVPRQPQREQVTPVTGRGDQPPPGNVMARATDHLSVKITWIPVAGASGYQVWRSYSGNSAEFVNLTPTPLPTGANTYIDSPLLPKTTFTYKVSARYSSGDWGMSLPESTTTLAAPPVTGLTVVSDYVPESCSPEGNCANAQGEPDAVRLTLTSMTGVAGYYVIRNNTQLRTSPIAETEFVDRNLGPGTYSYRVFPSYKLKDFPRAGATTEATGDPHAATVVQIVVQPDILMVQPEGTAPPAGAEKDPKDTSR
jgi:hypothetical protein